MRRPKPPLIYRVVVTVNVIGMYSKLNIGLTSTAMSTVVGSLESGWTERFLYPAPKLLFTQEFRMLLDATCTSVTRAVTSLRPMNCSKPDSNDSRRKSTDVMLVGSLVRAEVG